MKDHFQNFLEEDIFSKSFGDEKTFELKEGERRNVAILFADLQGFTSLSESLDHEEVQDLIDKLMNILSNTILKYGGYVDKYSGDEIMALFGAKVASEVDTQRAIFCAIEIHDNLKKFNMHLLENVSYRKLNIQLKMRIGINSGMVTAGKIGLKRQGDFTVYGDVVNLASRLEKYAPIGKIVVNNRTRRLVENIFEFEPLGEVSIKGKSTPSSVYIVNSIKEESTHQVKDYISPFIGHVNDLKLINDIYEKAMIDVNAHIGKPVLISVNGDAGVGKSRFVFEAIPNSIKKLGNQYFISSHATNVTKSPYYIFTHLVRNLINAHQSDSLIILERKVNEYFSQLADYLPENLSGNLMGIKPIIEFILGIKSEDLRLTIMGKELRVQIQRSIRIMLSTACYKANNSGLPYIIILEDLHWIDELSAETLIYVLDTFNIEQEKVNGNFLSPIFIINHRSDYQIPDSIIQTTHFHKIDILPLSKVECDGLIKALLVDKEYDIDVMDKLYRNSQGNPFYIEEWIYLFLKKSKGDLLTFKFNDNEIPDNINNLVLSRIDLLSTTLKSTLQCASVLGNQFYTSILKKIENNFYENSNTIDNLGSLCKNKFILPYFQQSDIYMFNHLTTCEVTYNTIFNTNKKKIHARTGEIYEVEYADNLSSNYYQLADHFYKGEVFDKAKKYLGYAAKQAKSIFDNKHSIEFYEKYIELLNEDENNQRMMARIQLCEVFIHIGKLKEAEKILIELISEIEVDNKGLHTANNIFADLGYIYHLLGNSIEAEKYINLQLDWSKTSSPEHYAFACDKMGKVYIDQGKVEIAKDYFLNNMKYYNSIGSAIDIINGTRNLAEVDLRLGHIDEAFTGFKKAYDLSGKVNALHEQSVALGNMGIIHLIKGEFNKALGIFTSVLDINIEIGDKITVSQSYGNLGIAHKELKNYEKAKESYKKQLQICKNIGFKPGIALANNNIGLVLYKKNDFARSIDYLLRALSINTDIGNISEIAKVNGNLGMISKDMGDFKMAMTYYSKAREYFDELGDERFSTIILGELGSLLLLQNKFYEAEEYLVLSINKFNEIKDIPNLAKYQLLLAELNCEIKKYDMSLDYLNQTEELLSNMDGDDSLLVEIAIGKAIIDYYQNKNSFQLSERMHEIIKEKTPSLEHEAIIHFELWKINKSESSHSKAIQLYSKLYKEAPKFIYKSRLKTLES
ncbi:MAG: tetratricopeptide repeat protein [Candidatus Marinimicrobia bacterium]|nr:tetratricopeptide repeat protein [Candidatus Neomarinimicrobiota bacterium]